MSTLSQLKPARLWQLFEKICSIPRPSKHEQKISLWIQSWAKDLGLSIKEDAVGNLIIKKPATQGMEDRQGIILQAHMDMVPQKNSDTEHNFLTDPIRPYIVSESDGDWVTAQGTTLGADNGVGLASALAVLASDDIVHGPLEALVTIDEEAGMTGAFGLAAGWLDGDILINTDSEQEGEVYMGCAGGIDVTAKREYTQEKTSDNVTGLTITINGLNGGHSGMDIHKGLGNANKIMNRMLWKMREAHGLRISEIKGGGLRNAVPRESFLSFVSLLIMCLVGKMILTLELKLLKTSMRLTTLA